MTIGDFNIKSMSIGIFSIKAVWIGNTKVWSTEDATALANTEQEGGMTNTPSFSANAYRFKISSESSSISSIPFIENV